MYTNKGLIDVVIKERKMHTGHFISFFEEFVGTRFRDFGDFFTDGISLIRTNLSELSNLKPLKLFLSEPLITRIKGIR
jgi:hypothetical protein